MGWFHWPPPYVICLYTSQASFFFFFQSLVDIGGIIKHRCIFFLCGLICFSYNSTVMRSVLNMHDIIMCCSKPINFTHHSLRVKRHLASSVRIHCMFHAWNWGSYHFQVNMSDFRLSLGDLVLRILIMFVMCYVI